MRWFCSFVLIFVSCAWWELNMEAINGTGEAWQKYEKGIIKSVCYTRDSVKGKSELFPYSFIVIVILGLWCAFELIQVEKCATNCLIFFIHKANGTIVDKIVNTLFFVLYWATLNGDRGGGWGGDGNLTTFVWFWYCHSRNKEYYLQ